MNIIRNHIQECVIVFFVFVLLGNMIVFVSSMKLSSEINQFEIKTNAYTQENILLEKQLADDMSFKTTHMYQEKWGFQQATSPLYVGQLQIALNNTQQ